MNPLLEQPRIPALHNCLEEIERIQAEYLRYENLNERHHISLELLTCWLNHRDTNRQIPEYQQRAEEGTLSENGIVYLDLMMRSVLLSPEERSDLMREIEDTKKRNPA